MAEKTVIISQQNLKPIKILKWKVREGFTVSIGSVILLYDFVKSEEKQQRKLKSSQAGTVCKLVVQEGAIIQPGETLCELEACIHPTVMKDMCAECGADLRKEDLNSSASVPMIHSVPELKVSLELAEKLGKADGERLIQDKKLVLLVDLDQTLIHTTNDIIPPNLKDVYHFQLYGPQSPWYHTRLRPGTQKFLKNVSLFYELHICTFGARNYAHKITTILDPDGWFFSNRVLSRDECFDPTSKTANLKALFPCGDHMVCIIDDREDVWSHASNLIHVKPYHFFKHTGDIHAPPGLEKDENDEKEGIDLSKIEAKMIKGDEVEYVKFENSVEDDTHNKIDVNSSNNEEQLSNNEEQLRNNEEQLSNNEEQLRNNEEQLSNSEEQLKNNEEQLGNNEEQLINNEEQLSNSEEQLRNNQEQLSNNEEQLRNNKEQLSNNEEQLRNNEEQLSNNEEKLRNNDEQLSNNEEQLRNNEEQLSNSKEQLRNNEEQLSKNEEQLRNNEEQLSNSEEQLRNNQEQLSNNEEQLRNNKEQSSNNKGQSSNTVEHSSNNEQDSSNKEQLSNNKEHSSNNIENLIYNTKNISSKTVEDIPSNNLEKVSSNNTEDISVSKLEDISSNKIEEKNNEVINQNDKVNDGIVTENALKESNIDITKMDIEECENKILEAMIETESNDNSTELQHDHQDTTNETKDENDKLTTETNDMISVNNTIINNEEKIAPNDISEHNNIANNISLLNSSLNLIEVEDSDDYLLYLEDILKQIHRTFYEEYDKMESGEVPDLKKVIPAVKAKVLKGCKLIFSGLVPTHVQLEHSKAYQVARSLGAEVTSDFVEDSTHLVAVRPGTAKVNAGRRKKNLKIVTPDWLWVCAERWEHVDEKIFPLNSKGSKNRHPPPHCSSPEHVPNYDVHETPTSRKRSPSGRFMDTINPLMSFSSADIADMDKEVEDTLDTESETDDDISKNSTTFQALLKEREENSSSSAESLTAEMPRGHKRTIGERNEDEDIDENTKDSDEFPSTKFRRGEQLDSDLDIGQDSNSEGSIEAPDEMDDGEWNMMGAALEREFLSNR